MYKQDIRKHPGELLDKHRYDRKTINNLKKSLSSWGGDYAIAGQLQQRPYVRNAGLFNRNDFQIIEDVRELGKSTDLVEIVRGWDLAGSVSSTAAYTCGVKLGLTKNNTVVMLDVQRTRLIPSKLEPWIKAIVEADGRHIKHSFPKDPGQAAISQKLSYARLLAGYNFIFTPEAGNKEKRAFPFSAQCASGNVFMIKSEWNEAFINEATSFPKGEYKDQIDACSRAYDMLLSANKNYLKPKVKLLS